MNKVPVFTPRLPRGVPIIKHGPLNRDPIELAEEIDLTHSAFLEVHFANGDIIARPAAELTTLMSEATLRNVNGRLIGITASDHRRCALRPSRNICGFLQADEAAMHREASYQPRFLTPTEFKRYMLDGRTHHLDAADYAHRLWEIDVAYATLPPGLTTLALQRFRKIAELYGADDLRSGELIQTQIYTHDEHAAVFGDERTEIIHVLCPTAHLEPDAPVVVGTQLGLGI